MRPPGWAAIAALGLWLVSLVVPVDAGRAQEPLALPQEYLLVTGGWYLNARCGFLTGDRHRAFRDHLMEVDEMARAALDRTYVQALRQAAQTAARAPERADCGADERAIVAQTAALARSFADAAAGVPAFGEAVPEI